MGAVEHGTLVLAAKGLSMRIGDRVVFRDVDVSVRAGLITALCGPSGTGKSLLARALMGVVSVRPGIVEGEMRLPASVHADRDLWHLASGRGMEALEQDFLPLRRTFFGHAPQNAATALNPARTAGRHLALAIGRRLEPVADVGAEVLRWLEAVGLDADVAHAVPAELSGGQCQRVALAGAAASLPAVLVADEPETGLDPILRRQIVMLLQEVCERSGAGLLLITHHEDTVGRVANEVVGLGAAP